jgi:hypothetical protein
VIFVHYSVLQFANREAVVAEDFDAVEVCCETVVICVEPKVYNCLFSRLFFNADLMFWHCVLLDEAMASWEFFFFFFTLPPL